MKIMKKEAMKKGEQQLLVKCDGQKRRTGSNQCAIQSHAWQQQQQQNDDVVVRSNQTTAITSETGWQWVKTKDPRTAIPLSIANDRWNSVMQYNQPRQQQQQQQQKWRRRRPEQSNNRNYKQTIGRGSSNNNNKRTTSSFGTIKCNHTQSNSNNNKMTTSSSGATTTKVQKNWLEIDKGSRTSQKMRKGTRIFYS